MNTVKFTILLATLAIMLILTFYTVAYILIELAEAMKPINNSNTTYTEKLEEIAESSRHILLAICYTLILAALLYLLTRVAEEIGKT